MRPLLLTTACFALMSAFAFPALAQNLSKAEIETIVREYLLNNPEVILESVTSYENRMQNEQQEHALNTIRNNKDWIYKNKAHGVAGNPKGDLTIVEFYDYNCGYCKQALTDILTLIEEDKNLKVIFIDLPILGESSLLASLWSKAAQAQGKFLEFHIPAMRHRGALNEATLENYARAANMDIAKAKAYVKASTTQDLLNDNLAKARDFGLSGTPAFISGDSVVRGYIGLDGMRQLITETRKAKK